MLYNYFLIFLGIHLAVSLPAKKVISENDDPPYKFQKITNTDKVYGLSLIWKQTSRQMPSSDHKTIENWDRTYRHYLEKTLHSLSIFYYYRDLQEFVASLHDGQNRVLIPGFLKDQLTFPPVHVVNIQNRAIVSNVAKEWQRKIPLGSEVTAVAGYPTRKYLDLFVFPYISSSNKAYRWDMAIEGDRDQGIGLLLGPAGSYFRLSIRTPSGQEHEYRITRIRKGDEIHWVRNEKPASFKWMRNQIAYMSYSLFTDDPANSYNTVQAKLNRARGIIIDLRMKEFRNTPIRMSLLNQLISNHKSLRFVFLTDTFTSGNAETFLGTIQKRPNITIVGETTPGNYGATKKIRLPGDGYAFIRIRQSGEQTTQQKNIQPDIPVSLTITDVIKSEDPLLERGMNVLQSR